MMVHFEILRQLIDKIISGIVVKRFQRLIDLQSTRPFVGTTLLHRVVIDRFEFDAFLELGDELLVCLIGFLNLFLI